MLFYNFEIVNKIHIKGVNVSCDYSWNINMTLFLYENCMYMKTIYKTVNCITKILVKLITFIVQNP